MPSTSVPRRSEKREGTQRMYNPEIDHEILVRVEQKLDKHIERHDTTHDEIEKDIRSRPTRQEVMWLFGGAGTLSGILFGAVRLFG